MSGNPLPTAIIAGVPRAGTSSVFSWLAAHPDVRVSTVKETCYFIDEGCCGFDERFNFGSHGLEGYRQFFPTSTKPNAKAVVESTPAYMFQRTAREVLPTLPTRPMFLFFLRKPADQLFSLYKYFSNNHANLSRDVSFPEFVALARECSSRLSHQEQLRYAIRNCRYVDHLEAWRRRCGTERVRIFLFEELKKNPGKFMGGVASALGVDPSFYERYDFDVHNATYQVRNFALHAVNARLRRLFPDGRLRSHVRSIYRKINTVPGQGTKTPEDLRVLDKLTEMYGPANEELAQRFGLDLSEWH